MNGLEMAQMATLLAMAGQGPASRDANSKALNESLIGSGQGVITAEAKKKAAKDAKKDKGIGKMLGAGAALAAAPFTGGASLSYLPMATSIGGTLDSAMMGDTGGITQNAMDAGMGYMMSKSIPKPAAPAAPAPSTTPGPTPMSSMSNMTTTGAPDPMAPGISNITVKPLAPPAAAPAAPTGGGGKNAPVGPMSMSSIAGPALVGLTAAGLQRGMANKQAAKTGAPPRSGPGGDPTFRTNMAPNAATMTPAQIRNAPDATKLAMMPTSNGDWGSGTLTKQQARAMGMSPEAIQEGIRNGTIVDDGSTGDFLKTAAGTAALAGLMRA